MAPYLEVATLLRDFGAEQGAQRFRQSPLLHRVEAVSPDNAQSLESFFTRVLIPKAQSLLLSKIARDSAILAAPSTASWCLLFIIANDQDFVASSRLRAGASGSAAQRRAGANYFEND